MKKVIVALVLAAVMTLVPFAAFAAGSVTPSSGRSSGSHIPSTSTTAVTSTSAAATAGSVQKQADGSQVFVKPDGTVLKSAWAVVEANGIKSWKYYGADGKMMIGWVWIAGADGVKKCYYLGSDGACYLNGRTPDGYDVNANGEWVSNGVVQTK